MVQCTTPGPKKRAEVAGSMTFSLVFHCQPPMKKFLENLKRPPVTFCYKMAPGYIKIAYSPLYLT